MKTTTRMLLSAATGVLTMTAAGAADFSGQWRSSLAIATALLLTLAASATPSELSRPHLETRHGARQLVVDGTPFLILGGELRNSSSSSRDYMRRVWPQL